MVDIEMNRFWTTSLLCALMCVLWDYSVATAARYSQITVKVNGVTYLKGGTADNGNLDPDQVWNLISTARLSPTPAFHKAHPKLDAAELILQGDDEDSEVMFEITFGGLARVKKLTVIQHTERDQPQKRYWSISGADVLNTRRMRFVWREHVEKFYSTRRD